MAGKQDDGTADVYGAAIVAGDYVVAVGDPTRPVEVDQAHGGHVTVHHGDSEPWSMRSRLVQVVTVRDSAGTRIDPGAVVDVAGRQDFRSALVVSVQYGVGLVVLDVDGVRVPFVPALLTVVGVDPGAAIGVVEAGVSTAPDGGFTVAALDDRRQLDRDVATILAGGVPCPVVPLARTAS